MQWCNTTIISIHVRRVYFSVDCVATGDKRQAVTRNFFGRGYNKNQTFGNL